MNIDIQVLIVCLVMVMLLFLGVQFQIRTIGDDLDSVSKKIDRLLVKRRDMDA